MLAELRSSGTLNDLSADWSGAQVAFWQPDSRSQDRAALLGVDLQRVEGQYGFSVHAEVDSFPVSCGATVTVGTAHFPTEQLTVDRKYVEPSPEDLKRAQDEIEHLRAIYAATTREKLWRGAFRIPLDNPPPARNFGRRRILNGEPGSPHSGVDLAAPAGTPVHAAQRGKVVLADSLYFSGNTVVVDHGLGLYTFYGHLKSIAVKVGDTVDTGALLGEVGATGRVTGPHLHWGVSLNSARVDPMQLVALFAPAKSSAAGR